MVHGGHLGDVDALAFGGGRRGLEMACNAGNGLHPP